MNISSNKHVLYIKKTVEDSNVWKHTRVQVKQVFIFYIFYY